LLSFIKEEQQAFGINFYWREKLLRKPLPEKMFILSITQPMDYTYLPMMGLLLLRQMTLVLTLFKQAILIQCFKPSLTGLGSLEVGTVWMA
jgi:hypothetical protein